MSGNLVILRRRIRTVRNTQKLTRAMKTVSAVKLRRASSDLNRNRPYMMKLEALLFEVGRKLNAQDHPLMRVRESGARILVVVTADKGLCGSFNSHIIHHAEGHFLVLKKNGGEVHLVTVGNKGYRYFHKHQFPIKHNFPGMMARLNTDSAQQLSAYLQELYSKEEIAAIEMACTEFISASRQKQSIVPLFPLPVHTAAASEAEEEETYILEPDAQSLFQILLPRYVQARIYRLLLASVASEEAARMVAMDLATRNASDMIRFLQMSLNKMRQAIITKELLEIMTATEALKK